MAEDKMMKMKGMLEGIMEQCQEAMDLCEGEDSPDEEDMMDEEEEAPKSSAKKEKGLSIALAFMPKKKGK